MAEKLDQNDLVTSNDLLLTNMIQIEILILKMKV
jgi:hypothetical protein